MTNEELTLYNIGENLDSLMTLDPRGYGVCRILYRAARDYAGEPLSVHAAKGLVAHIHSGDLVYIITGLCTVALEAAGDGRHGVFYDAGALSD